MDIGCSSQRYSEKIQQKSSEISLKLTQFYVCIKRGEGGGVGNQVSSLIDVFYPNDSKPVELPKVR